MEKADFIKGAPKVLSYFYDLSQIPRQSGNNEQVKAFLKGFAEDLGLEVTETGEDDLIVRKNAYEGYENTLPVVLEAHYDMVCQQSEGVEHDFNGPLELMRDGDRIYANGTTLGADNGLGVAACMAILAGSSPHPPLEVLFTSSEETDMAGAKSADMSLLKGKLFITLDAHALLVCGAGELEAEITLDCSREDAPAGCCFRKISVSGLKGGHTGANAVDEPGNAVILLGRILNEMTSVTDYRLAEVVNGNTSPSAFAREAAVTVCFPGQDEAKVSSFLKRMNRDFVKELAGRSDDVRVSLETAEPLATVMKEETKERFVSFLTLVPDGIRALHHEFDSTVAASVNCVIAGSYDHAIRLMILIRSSYESMKYDLLDKIRCLCRLTKADIRICHDLPQWDKNIRADILKLAEAAFNSHEPELFPGTLECGVFQKKDPDLMFLGLGIPYYYQHSPAEHAFVSEIRDHWKYLLWFLDRLKDIK